MISTCSGQPLLHASIIRLLSSHARMYSLCTTMHIGSSQQYMSPPPLAHQRSMCYASSTAQPKLQPDSQDVLRERLLQAAMKHVPQHGWSFASLHAAAAELGYSPAAAGLVTNGATGLVQHFVDTCNSALVLELQRKTPELQAMRVRDRIVAGVRVRLEMVAPYIGTWPQALSLQAHPEALPTSLKQLAAIVDEIWRAAGDTSTGSNWYTKRALLAGVYTATELYMLTDGSPGFADTWECLGRRVDDVVAAGKQLRQVGGQLEAVLQVLKGMRP